MIDRDDEPYTHEEPRTAGLLHNEARCLRFDGQYGRAELVTRAAAELEMAAELMERAARFLGSLMPDLPGGDLERAAGPIEEMRAAAWHVRGDAPPVPLARPLDQVMAEIATALGGEADRG